jgi:carbon-monoxide dehydrogenase small subunit
MSIRHTTQRDGDVSVRVSVNGIERVVDVEPRLTAADALRDLLGLTSVHLACEHGVCGACTVLVDGDAVRSCLLFACQLDGTSVTTVEGLAPAGDLTVVQQAMRECHGLQCGFCTPGFVISITAFLGSCPNPDDAQIREGLSGNLCRCTGYDGIVAAVRRAAAATASTDSTDQQVPR